MFLTSHFCTYRIKLFHRGKKRARDENVEGFGKGENKVTAAALCPWNATEILISLLVLRNDFDGSGNFPKTALFKDHKPKGLNSKKSHMKSGLWKIFR